MITKNTRQQRKKRISSKVRGIHGKLRLSIFRSNSAMYAQIIDDEKGETIVGILEKKSEAKTPGVERARTLGKALAVKAKEKKITKVVFDKGHYKYHGKVKAFADGAREGGLRI